MDGGEEVVGELIVARGDAAEILQPTEHPLDRIAVAVEHAAERRLEASVALGRDVRDGAALVDGGAHGIGVVAAIGDHQHVWRQRPQQRLRRPAIGSLATGQQKGARPTLLVAQRMELGGASAAADADRLRPLPPFPPAAQR